MLSHQLAEGPVTVAMCRDTGECQNKVMRRVSWLSWWTELRLDTDAKQELIEKVPKMSDHTGTDQNEMLSVVECVQVE